MASTTMTPTKLQYTQYNQDGNVSNSSSGWHSWTDSAVMGYASKWDAMGYKFKTGTFSGSHSYSIKKLKVSLYHQRVGSGAGNFVFYIVSSNPTGSSLDTFKKNNTAWGSAAFTSSSSWHTTNCEVSCDKKLSSNTEYYLIVCCDSGGIQKVSSGNFSLSFEYDYINALGDLTSKPSAPNNHHNNTFSASCSAVGSPSGNTTVTTLQYKLGSGSWTDAGGEEGTLAIARMKHTASESTASQTVKVRIKANPTYGDTKYSPESDAVTLKNYIAPTNPSEAPSVTKTKTRFTVKEPWTVSWSNTNQQAKKKNNSSSVAGYRIIMLVKKGGTGGWVSEPFKIKATNKQGWKYLGQNPDNKGNGDTWYTVDTSDLDSMTEITIDPMLQGFVPGDIVKFGIRPYILWKAADPEHEDSFTEVYKLFSDGPTINGTKGVDSEHYTFTDEITVQNAGVVRIKTGADKSSFKEGIVWVKINNTGTKTTDWVEADVVKVKTSSGWKESE